MRACLTALVLLFAAGCLSVDQDVVAARAALDGATRDEAVRWSEELATESVYSTRLGMVEAGRVQMLCGNFAKAESWFRKAVDAAVDRKERVPKIKLGDVANTAMSATLTDDRTRTYYLAPYEVNLALGYGILSQLVNGHAEDALADARLAVYLQDSLAQTYGADLKASQKSSNANITSSSASVCARESQKMAALMADTRNSWENPVLWWLTGVLFEASGETDMAWQSYRKAFAVRGDCAVFAADAARADAEKRLPARDRAKLVVIFEEGLVPLRESLKIPVPLYTAMSIDIPVYRASAYAPGSVAISGATNLVAASPALNIRALACRDLSEQLPGVVARNITRGLVQAGAQAAVNCSNGNGYAWLAVFAANAVVSAIRRADTRSWATLPDGQQVWEEGGMEPGAYQIGVAVHGRTVAIPVTLAAGETKIVWIADTGKNFHTAQASLGK